MEIKKSGSHPSGQRRSSILPARYVSTLYSCQPIDNGVTQEELVATCHRELKAALRGLPELQWSRVIAEKRATVACTPAMNALRPNTAIPGVVLAGDYTDSDYPPTLEAAVRSGVRAANQAINWPKRNSAWIVTR